VVTNLLRAGVFVLLFLAGDLLPVILVLNMVISTITVFFAPAEAAMIPSLVPRRQLLSANGVFILTLNAAFAIGFALLGPIFVTLFGAPALILIVAVCYLVAAGFCWTLPPAPPPAATIGEGARSVAEDAEQAMGSTIGQLREGIAFIRLNRKITWSLVYLGLQPKDFAVVVLPLGFGIVMGILILNSFGHLAPRRRIIEGGLVSLGVLLVLMAGAGPLSRFLQRAEAATGLVSLADFTSLIAIVVFIALLAGIAYAFVAIPSQTQLQEDIPEDVRGRVFGVLNMLVSVASFAPIIVVGPVSDVVGTTNVLFVVAVAITVSGLASILTRGPLNAIEAKATAHGPAGHAGLDPVAVAIGSEVDAAEERRAAATGEDTMGRGDPAEDTMGRGDPAEDE
jgi:MFS family permease